MDWIMELPPEIITGIAALVIAAASLPALYFKNQMAKIEAKREKERLESEAEREKERLESETKHQALENELAEIRKEQSLMDIFAKVVEGLGRMDRGQRETAQQLTSAINAQTEAQNEASQKLSDIDNRLAFSTTATKAHVDGIANDLKDEFRALGNRLDTLSALFTDNQNKESEKLKSVIDDFSLLVERVSPILKDISENCKEDEDEDMPENELPFPAKETKPIEPKPKDIPA